MPGLGDLYNRSELDLESLVTGRVELDDVNEVFEAIERQDGFRMVITCS